jgi:hypothetical protein
MTCHSSPVPNSPRCQNAAEEHGVDGGAAVEQLGVAVVGHADRAVDLHCLGGHAAGRVAGGGDRLQAAHGRVAAAVGEPGRVPGQQAGGLHPVAAEASRKARDWKRPIGIRSRLRSSHR